MFQHLVHQGQSWLSITQGQSWVGLNKWSLLQPYVRTIGGIFHFPMPPKV